MRRGKRESAFDLSHRIAGWTCRRWWIDSIAKGFNRGLDARRELERIQRIDVQLLQRSRTIARSLSIPPPLFCSFPFTAFSFHFDATSATNELGINSFILVDCTRWQSRWEIRWQVCFSLKVAKREKDLHPIYLCDGISVENVVLKEGPRDCLIER